MTIKLLALGKTDKAELQRLISEYEQRLRHYVKFQAEFVPDLKNTKTLSEQQQKQKEGEALLKRVDRGDLLILWDERGTSYTSIAFADYLQKKMNSGVKQLIFAIGGPYGFSEAVYQRANGKISLSQMTLSHQMVRLFVTEQIYRAFTILRNEPYHHQ
ncbi:23S rRNA (pseudouridine(1915)-N(3))-methyltransferase RlmH [Flavobacteriaceae bacterium 3-367]|uniref:23S rRNA (pseudouridine(1915)-N(3))-methyltransferase RlmH n=1 Tax=Eudoraea algarum TaxID=3417568 RepID=UPI00327AA82C